MRAFVKQVHQDVYLDFRSMLLLMQISTSGMAVPPLPQLASIPAGLSILNSPDVDFKDPPRFPLLTEVSGSISIAGCNSEFLSRVS